MHVELQVYRLDTGVTFRVIDASSRVEAVRQLELEGFRVLDHRETAVSIRRPRTAAFPEVIFVTELVALLRAGLNILEAVDALTRRSRRGAIAEVLMQLRLRLSEGLTLSKAMELDQGHFSALLVATVKASERTGNLLDAVQRYLTYRRLVDTARNKLVASLIYPTAIVAVGGIVSLFLLLFVIPKFAGVYEHLGDKLPKGTAFLIEWGRLVRDHGWGLASVLTAIILVGIYALSQPGSRAAFSRLCWRTPWLGQRLRLFELSRFYRTVGMLQASGIPILSALSLSQRLLMQPALAQGLLQAELCIKDGKSVAESFQIAELCDELALRLLTVGERNGELGEMLSRTADFYDEELARWLDIGTKLIEPVLMVIVGGLIGVLVLLMYLPIFQLADGL